MLSISAVTSTRIEANDSSFIVDQVEPIVRTLSVLVGDTNYNKIEKIKLVRALLKCGLREAKDFVEACEAHITRNPDNYNVTERPDDDYPF
jgi:ribosomal protein L7/L12